MLDDYEKGFSMENLDRFFGVLKKELVPFLKKVMEEGKKVEDSFLKGDYPEKKQEELGRFLAEYVGFDFDRGVMAVSAHPFTTNLHNKDVRITTHYMPQDMFSNLYSVAHEGGHALYELNVDPKYDYTTLAGGATTGLHESQSRLFENYVGRSRAFIHYLYPTLLELFPQQLNGVTEEEIYRAVNRAEPSLIRTEADELTYSLHIMVRYELEKALMQGTLTVADLPAAWNAKYKEYLGVDVPDDTHGCLQDIHWAMGDMGYFPSYALGSAYSAQAVDDLRKTMDLDAQWAEGNMQPLKDALRSRVWQHGRAKEPQWLVQSLCGGAFDAAHYTNYLKNKYTELYGL
jgi:carboxypeptidase Taq